MLSSYDTYRMFIALKYHFERETYDYFKYNGKVKTSHETFLTRRDMFKFQRVSRMVDDSEMRDLLVSNIIDNRRWIGDIATDEAVDCYNHYMKRKQSLSYTFSNDLDKLFMSNSPNDAFRVTKGELPTVLYAVMSKDICIETFTILDSFINFAGIYDSKLQNLDIIWSSWSLLLKKYKPFLEYDKVKFRNILKDKIGEYEHGIGKEQEAILTKERRSKEIA